MLDLLFLAVVLAGFGFVAWKLFGKKNVSSGTIPGNSGPIGEPDRDGDGTVNPPKDGDVPF